MFHRILVATDLSAASDHVIRCASALRSLGAEEAVLCHALGLRHLDELKYVLIPSVEPKLFEQKTVLESVGLRTSVEIATGLPHDEIARVARMKDASLIVAGTHGRSLFPGVLLGSVALHILHNATRPVLLVRLQVAQDGARCEVACSDLTHHVLYPTDFSDTAERALEYVAHLVSHGAKTVTLLHVQDRTRIAGHLEHKLDEFNRIDRDRLERVKRKLELLGATDVRIEIPYGAPVQEILARAGAQDRMLIVMGAQGRGFLPEVFLGSVSHNVVRHAPKPVLLIPSRVART